MHIVTKYVLRTLQQAGAYIQTHSPRPLHALSDLYNWNEILHAYEALADERSKETFMKLMALRLVYFATPPNIACSVFSLYPEKVWKELTLLAEKTPGVPGDYLLDRIETWVLKGYEYKECKAQQGDVVIDAGAFTGNTVKYFEQCVGSQGKIYAFEPMEKIFATLHTNMGHLPHVHLVQAAVSKKDGHVHIAEQNFPGASIDIAGDICVTTRSIDSFIKEQGIERLDFLKMDIEGAEMDALTGAQRTIQRFTPKMAICVYHKSQDIFQIYKHILSINPHYTFYLKHSSNTVWETVLFCMPSKNAFIPKNRTAEFEEDICITRVLHDSYKIIYDLTEDSAGLKQEKNTLEEHVRTLITSVKKFGKS